MKTIFLFLLCICSFSAIAQKSDSTLTIQVDTIAYKKILGTNIYSMYGKKIRPYDLQMKFDLNSPELHLMQQARVNSTFSYIFSFAGGMLIGYEVGKVARGIDPDPKMFLAGVGLLGVSIPFNIAFNKNSLKAVRLYNAKMRSSFQ